MIQRWGAGVIGFLCYFALLETGAMGAEDFVLLHRLVSTTTTGADSSVTVEFELVNATPELQTGVTLALVFPPSVAGTPQGVLDVGDIQPGEHKHLTGTTTIPTATLRYFGMHSIALYDIHYRNPRGIEQFQRTRGFPKFLTR